MVPFSARVSAPFKYVFFAVTCILLLGALLGAAGPEEEEADFLSDALWRRLGQLNKGLAGKIPLPETHFGGEFF